MLRRLRDALLLNLAVVYVHHLAVAVTRLLGSYRTPEQAAACCEHLAVTFGERRPFCDQ